MSTAQPQLGVLAFGTTNHAYLELDRHPEVASHALASAVGVVKNAVLTGSGCTVVIGFRPEIGERSRRRPARLACTATTSRWSATTASPCPAPSTTWSSGWPGGSQDVVFDAAAAAVAELADVAGVAESEGWAYQHRRDLTGFQDRTENPPLVEAPSVALVPADQPGAGGTVLLLQRWPHDTAAWGALAVTAQEAVIGRTKVDSIELDPKPASAHAARTDQDEVGKIVGRNLAYGSVTRHGTMFVGLSADQKILHEMLRRMAGIDGQPRDDLTRYTSAETGAYYFLPSLDALLALGAADG